MKIHEATRPDGALESVFIRFESGILAIVAAEEVVTIPEGAVERVMSRYGLPIDIEARVVPVDALDLGQGRSLRHVRHLAKHDVIARDYLVYDCPGKESRAALATTVAGALAYLARAAESQR